MMKIKEMFEKPIDRKLQGVVVVGDDDKENIQQELEEYVITKELAKHFAELFENYKTGIIGNTRQNGVWISGFFGSGKSHFLKMVSYLLGNPEIEGKHAIDYFIDDNKIKDPTVLADVKLASETPTDVILFNIDSKAEQTGKQSNDALVNVFLKVFNDIQGFYGNLPQLADLEKQLKDDNLYDAFKEKFKEEYGKDWKSARSNFDFIEDTLIDVLVDIGFMSEAAARNWFRKATKTNYHISIEDFANRVNDYLKTKEKNHHLVFLVDEIGQYIGDDSQLMLNLQTIQEELAKKTLGKAWIMVTSQQDIDSITKVKGRDFSKIQGRFDTRLSLTSSNADEVIKERVLKKNSDGAKTLEALYEVKETDLKNKIRFNDTPEMKFYSNKKDFVENYPFVPYQFNLLGSVLNSIRMHGASGKHISEGERSMLALFKESAQAIMESETGALVPLYRFYDTIENVLDAAHSRVIKQALENEYINPDHEDDNFNVNVLKVLFLIKYVKELENATLENITSLMISSVDEDRMDLQNRVEKALKVLEHETLIQKNQSRYVFLTEEEQEIGREIEQQDIETNRVIHKIAETIFEELLKETKYKYPKLNNRYIFNFSQSIDDRVFKDRTRNQLEEPLNIRIITPFTDQYPEDLLGLKSISIQSPEILVVLPKEEGSYFDEIEKALKIESFSQFNSAAQIDRFKEIVQKKNTERLDRLEAAKLSLEDSLKDAIVLVNGSEITSKGNIIQKIEDGLENLVRNIYPRLDYITEGFNSRDLEIMLDRKDQQTFGPVNGIEPNILAQEEIFKEIKNNAIRSTKIPLKIIADKFMRHPYGFNNDDINWIIGRLYKRGEITLRLNGENLSLTDKSAKEIANILTNQRFRDKIMLSAREHIDEKLLKYARVLLEELGYPAKNLKEDELKKELDIRLNKKREVLEKLNIRTRNGLYPGSEVIREGLFLIREQLGERENIDYFKSLTNNEDDWEDLLEDLEEVESFYRKDSTQLRLFKDALDKINIYEKDKSLSNSPEVDQIVNEIKQILKHKSPYRLIPKLPDLLNKFVEAYSTLLEKYMIQAQTSIEEDRDYILDVLSSKPYKQEYIIDFSNHFKKLLEDVETANTVLDIYGIERSSEQKKRALLSRINSLDEEYLKEQEKPKDDTETTDVKIETEPPKHIVRRKNKTIRSLFGSSYRKLEGQKDIDTFLDELREKLEEEIINKDIILDLEF